MKEKVTLRELVGARIVLAICIAVYYWCWARNGSYKSEKMRFHLLSYSHDINRLYRILLCDF